MNCRPLGRQLLAFLGCLTLLVWGGPAISGETIAASGPEQPKERPEPADTDPTDDEKPKRPLKVHWDAGLHVDGVLDFLHLKLGGDVQNDTAGYVNTDSAEELLGEAIEDGVEWRRARLYAQGQLFRHLEFKLRYDFAAGNPSLKDAYFGFVNLPIPTLGFTAGRFKAPLGLDGYTGADDLVFMERSLMSEAFLPSRNTGFMLHGDAPKHRVRWSFAILQPEADAIDLSDTDNLGWSARLAAAFKKKSNLLHVGADFWRRNVDTTLQYASRPESHIAPFFVDTGDVPADSADITVFELGAQRGRVTLQSELTLAKINHPDGTSDRFLGAYAQGSVFLTGETAPYRSERGTFTRPYPKHSIRERGSGAMELGLRYSRIDLSDGLVSGGFLSNWTLGFNWYPTYHAKLMLNAILANLRGAEPVAIFQMRLQVAF